MIVLGIDPGYDRVGVAVMELINGQEILHHSECIETNKTLPIHTRIKHVGDTIHNHVTTYNVDTLAIETLFFNKNVKTAMSVAEARGVIIYAAESAGCTIYEFSPQEIKIATTGHGNSDKTAVTAMVKQLIPTAPSTAIDDEYDAIAVGITYLAHHGRRQ